MGQARGWYEDGIIQFRQLPFAKADRWCEAVPVEHWNEPAGSREYGPAPIQPPPSPFWAKKNHEDINYPQDEDCLHLNIWAADVTRPGKAVLFWIYGGSYIQGYNAKGVYLPYEFVKAHPDILVVAPNYRVGVLGSLNLSALTGEEKYRKSNNLALLDLVAALRWVNKNIADFGGDPERVTLYGHSAGSNAISHLLVMPMARNLFRRAVCQSSFSPDVGTVALDTSTLIADKFFQLAGISTLEEALALTPEQILAAQGGLFRYSYHGSRASKMFSPVEDNITVMEHAFECFVNGEINAEQIMIGTSEGEYDQMFSAKSCDECRKFVIDRNADKHVTEEDENRFIALHPEITEMEALMTIHNDLGLRLGGEFIGRACSAHIPVYEYLFRLRDPEDQSRARHGAPCNYVFGTLIPKGAPGNLKSEMMDAWAGFIRTGDPNHPSIPQWEKYQPDGAVMCIDASWTPETGYWKESFAFWGSRFAEYTLLPENL